MKKCERCNQPTKQVIRDSYCQKCYRYLLRHNLIRRLPISPSELTKEQEEVLIGSLLGDGCIHFGSTTKYPCLTIKRKLSDIEYLKYEYNIFKDFCNQPIKTGEYFDNRTKKVYYYCRFTTRPSEIFLKYRHQWYSQGVKSLPKDLSLSPLTCAIWFCDDGCISVRNNRLVIKLATQSFTKKENKRLSQIFRLMFNEYFCVCQHDNKYELGAADSATKKFIKYIEYKIPTSMNRKIKWTKEHFMLPKTYARLKNRDKLNLNDKEKKVLIILLNGNAGPKTIANNMDWHSTHNKSAPSGITLYLDRFVKYDWVQKHGTTRPTTKYGLTTKGREIAVNLLSKKPETSPC